MPKARVPRRRSPSGVKIVAAGVGGVLGVLIGLGLLVAAVPLWSERGDYLAARPCPTSESHGCVRQAHALVLGKRVWRGRSHSYDLRLRVLRSPGADVGVELPAPDDIWPRLRVGDVVGIRLWGRDVAAVEAGGVRAETTDSPAVEVIEIALAGLFVSLMGAVGVLYAFDAGERAAPVLAPFGIATTVLLLQMQTFDVYDPAALLSTFVFVGAGLGALVALRQWVRR